MSYENAIYAYHFEGFEVGFCGIFSRPASHFCSSVELEFRIRREEIAFQGYVKCLMMGLVQGDGVYI